MALIIPTAVSTYGDATKTSGRFQKYILAQFRSDADLEWVRRTRSKLIKSELKFGDIRENRPSLKKDQNLWSQIGKGVGQGTIIVIDPGEYEPLARETLLKADVEKAGSEIRAIVDACTSEVLAGTPIAYLPEELHRVLDWETTAITSLDRFKPDQLAAALGGSLKHAVVFAARAHAIFDVGLLDSARRTSDALKSPRARVVLPELLSTARFFDTEHPVSVDMLNEAVDVIASAMEDVFPDFDRKSDKPLVIETDSRGYDELQASDVAVGWAMNACSTALRKHVCDSLMAINAGRAVLGHRLVLLRRRWRLLSELHGACRMTAATLGGIIPFELLPHFLRKFQPMSFVFGGRAEFRG
jgi:hypothetical protein